MFAFKAKYASLLSAAVLLAACGGGAGDGGSGQVNNTAPGGALPPGSAVIGAAGGTVTSSDGKVRLEIPAGALGNSQTITIESVEASSLPADLADADVVYEMKPDGLQFAQPVKASVVLPGRPVQADGSMKVATGALLSMSRGQLETLGNQQIRVNGDNNTVTATGTLQHFSSLVFTSKLATSSGIEVGNPGYAYVRLVPLPIAMVVGKQERAGLETALEGFSEGEDVHGAIHYRDESVNLVHEKDASVSVSSTDPGYFTFGRQFFELLPKKTVLDYGNYTCTSPLGAYFQVPVRIAELNLRLRLVSKLIPLPTVETVFERSHRCATLEPPPPPPPPPPPADDRVRVVPVNVPGLEGMVRFAAALAPAFGIEISDEELADIYGVSVSQLKNLAAFGWTGGQGIIDITDGSIVRSKDLSFMSMYGSLPTYKFGQGCLFGYGSTSASNCFDRSIGDFGLTEVGVGRGPYTDAGVLGTVQTQAGKHTLKWSVDAGRVSAEYVRPDGEIGTREAARPIGASRGWYVGGPLVGLARSAYFMPDYDRALVVTGDADKPGQLWMGNISDPAGGTLIGGTGEGNHDTRQIRCALPLCAISNFKGKVSTVWWDGMNTPRFGNPIEATGSVGIDVRAEGSQRVVRSADYDNRTVTKAVFSVGGDLLSTRTKTLPEACSNPGHVIGWEMPGEATKTVVSCRAGLSSVIVVLDDGYFDD